MLIAKIKIFLGLGLLLILALGISANHLWAAAADGGGYGEGRGTKRGRATDAPAAEVSVKLEPNPMYMWCDANYKRVGFDNLNKCLMKICVDKYQNSSDDTAPTNWSAYGYQDAKDCVNRRILPNFYELFGFNKIHHDHNELRKAYLKLLLQYHPDKTATMTLINQVAATEISKRLNQANEIFTDVSLKQNYDRMLEDKAKSDLVWAVSSVTGSGASSTIYGGSVDSNTGAGGPAPAKKARVATQAEKNAQLISAVLRNDLAQVEASVVDGADIDAKNSEVYRDGGKIKINDTPLILATREGHISIVDYLIKHGANINYRRLGDDVTALMIAVERGRMEIVEMLLNNGAYLDMQDNSGFSALMLAVDHKFTAIVELLMNRAVQINAINDQGMTALMIAIKRQSKDIAIALLRAGANVDPISSEGMTALMLSLKYRLTDVAELLLKHRIEKINLRGSSGDTVLGLAINIGNIAIIESLLAQGADVNMPANDINMPANNDGNVPLMLAGNRHAEIVQLLIKHGAQANAMNNKGQTVLMYLIDRMRLWDDSEVVLKSIAFLINAGADVNTVGSRNDTALSMASYNLRPRSAEIISLLLKANANVNAKNFKGNTALMSIVESKGSSESYEALRFKIVQLLLNAKADPNIKNNNGDTALMIAKNGDELKSREIIKLLEESMGYASSGAGGGASS